MICTPCSIPCINAEEVSKGSKAEDGCWAIDYSVGFDYGVSPSAHIEFSNRVMRNRTIKYVKVLWTNQSEREATWELEAQMREKYPELFEPGK